MTPYGYVGVMAAVVVAALGITALPSEIPATAVIPIPNTPRSAVPTVQAPQPIPRPELLPGPPVPVPSSSPSSVPVKPPAATTAPAPTTISVPAPAPKPLPPSETESPDSVAPSPTVQQGPCAVGLRLDPVLGVCVRING